MDDLDGDEVDREQGEHHDHPLGLLRQLDLSRVLTRRLLDGLDDWSHLLPDVGDVVEESARDVSAHTQIMDGVDEGQLEIRHQSDWSVENGHPHRAGDVFNERDRALVQVANKVFVQKQTVC